MNLQAQKLGIGRGQQDSRKGSRNTSWAFLQEKMCLEKERGACWKFMESTGNEMPGGGGTQHARAEPVMENRSNSLKFWNDSREDTGSF